MDPLTYNSSEPMPPQTADWTCSACSLAWLNRALYIEHATSEWDAVDYIGQPDNINPTYGLMDASGARLVECLRAQGAPAVATWPTWDQALTGAVTMPLLIGGVAWNHWVGVREAGTEVLRLANSAPGWMGIYDELSEDDWNFLGPFAVIYVPLLRNFPPPPQS